MPPQAPLACPSHTAGPRPGQSPRGVTFGSRDLRENKEKLDEYFQRWPVLGKKEKKNRGPPFSLCLFI